MAVAFDAYSRVGNGFTSSLDLSHTCSGSDRYLFAWAIVRSGSDRVTGITYNGVAMTRLLYQNNSSFGVYLYGVTAPTTGANNITYTLNAAVEIDAAGMSFTGVDQTTPVADTDSVLNAFQGSPASIAITTPAGGMGVSFINANDDKSNTFTPESGQTEAFESDFTLDLVALGYKPDAATVGWTWAGGASKNAGHVAAALAPSAGGGDTTAPTLSSPTGTATGSTTASGSVSTDEANGTLYRLASTNATETAATVKAAALTTAVSATGVQSTGVTFSGLTPSTTYYAHYLHSDAAGNDSAVASSASFTTDAAGGTSINPGAGTITITGYAPVVSQTSGGTITTEPLKNNTGTLLANETGAAVHVYETTGALVVTKTGQTTNASGIMTISDALIQPATEYRIVIVLGSGAEGMDRITAA